MAAQILQKLRTRQQKKPNSTNKNGNNNVVAFSEVVETHEYEQQHGEEEGTTSTTLMNGVGGFMEQFSQIPFERPTKMPGSETHSLGIHSAASFGWFELVEVCVCMCWC